ncbi:class I SAM-dependent methyltransferase [Candidatus Woesebacteria bacterium]|nr:class I SAM-dependent methyltransferase [Candidatus Woesebacteria bacterium]
MFAKYLDFLYKEAEREKEKDLEKALAVIPPNGTFLDIGCWDGKKTLRWASAARAKRILGIEVVKDIAKKARKKNIKVYEVDVDKGKWPLESSSIDCVLSNLVIEHLTDVDNFISESFRVLKKGGYTIVCTNNLASWHNIVSLLFGWAPFDLTNSSPKLWSMGNPLVLHKNEGSLFGKSYCHKCVYTIRWLKEWYGLYGFKLINFYGSGYYPLPSFFGKIDKAHAAFITLTFKK